MLILYCKEFKLSLQIVKNTHDYDDTNALPIRYTDVFGNTKSKYAVC